MVDRRKFLSAAGLLLPAMVHAQAGGRRYRIGFLGVERDWGIAKEAVQRLRELGYIEGRNLTIEYRHSRQRLNALPQFAQELVRERVELIVAWGVLSVLAARQATSSIPIVMVYGADPVGMGFVPNLARPGGNVTGLAWGDEVQFVDKFVELVKAAIPSAQRLGVMWNLDDKAMEEYRRRVEGSATVLGLRTISTGIRDREDIPPAFQRLKKGGAAATLVMLDHLTIEHQGLIEEHASLHRMPLVTPAGFGYKDAIIKFGPKVEDQPRRAAEYAARILNGAKPGDLPVEKSRNYELIVNLKTARALDIVIPEVVLLRADTVIP